MFGQNQQIHDRKRSADENVKTTAFFVFASRPAKISDNCDNYQQNQQSGNS